MARTPNSFLKNLKVQSSCINALENCYWSEGVRGGSAKKRCKRCGSEKIHLVREGENVPNLYQCYSCKRQFNVCTNTPFQGTKIKLPIWFEVNWYLRNSRSVDMIRKIVGLSKRDTINLIKKIEELDDIYDSHKGYGHSHGFLWAVRRRYSKSLLSR